MKAVTITAIQDNNQSCSGSKTGKIDGSMKVDKVIITAAIILDKLTMLLINSKIKKSASEQKKKSGL